MSNKEQEIKKILDIVNYDLSKKEQMFILGVIEGLKLSKTM